MRPPALTLVFLAAALALTGAVGCRAASPREDPEAKRRETAAVFLCLADHFRGMGGKKIALVYHQTTDRGRDCFLRPHFSSGDEYYHEEFPDYPSYKKMFPSLKRDAFAEIYLSCLAKKDIHSWLTPPADWQITDTHSSIISRNSPTSPLITFAAPAFDKELTQAVIYVETFQNLLAGYGEWVFLEKRAGSWEIISHWRVWIS